MANHKSAKKRARQAVKRTLVNKVKVSRVRTMVKNLRNAIADNNKEKALELAPKAQSLISKLAKSGIIKRENAARKTSRLAAQVANLK
ncbi:MAG: 30S ribosomal protein S20 [Bacteriovoracaceae bacterium]